MNPRARLRAGLAGLVVLAVAGVTTAVVLRHGSSASCGSEESSVAATQVPAVLSSVSAAHDPHVTRLAAAVRRWHLGRVVGAVGYDYGQWLRLGGTSEGLVAWTARNPVAGFLGDSLAARWGLRQAHVPHAWDADATTFFQLELAAHQPLRLTAYRLDDGRREWCAIVGTVATPSTGRYGTAVLADGDLVAVAQAADDGVRVERLAARDGRVRWSAGLTGVDQADFVGAIGHGLVLVGGRAAYQQGDPGIAQPPGPVLRAVSAQTGRLAWSDDARQLHVVGVVGTTIVVSERGPHGPVLVGLGLDGRERWTRPAHGLGNDLAVAGDTVVADTGSALVGIDPAGGRTTWRTPYPTRAQYLPYGFQLDAQPMLDAAHLLVGGTTGLHAVDVDTGRVTTYPLPTDGINTTYWPYQVVVTGRLLAVVTNTAAVVVRLG